MRSSRARRSANSTRTDERWTLHSCSQGVFGLKNMLRDVLGAPAEKVRILTGNVGGSFGMKAAMYPEYVCILHAARELGRPVKWTDDRSGSFVSDHHGRAFDMEMEVAFDKDGLILAIRLTGYGDLGGFCAAFGPLLPTVNVAKNTVSVYRTPLLEVSTKCVFTNTTWCRPIAAPGGPEGNYNMERALDLAAIEMGIDRFELRKRNFIKPREMPFKSSAGHGIRRRRLPGRVQACARACRCQRLQGSASATARRRASCAGLASAAIWRPRPPAPRKWAASASRTTAR